MDSMNENRISSLENRIDHLEKQVHELNCRLSGSVDTSTAPRDIKAEKSEIAPLPSFSLGFSPTRFMFLLGRSILVLAGGFLLRALTGSGGIPSEAGFALGLVYSLGLIFITHRSLGGKDQIGATSLGLTAAIIAYPFLTESITKLNLISAQMGGLSLALITAAGLWTAWHRRQRFLAWIFSMSALVTILGLGFTTKSPEFFALLLLLLGAVTSLLAYTRHWHLKRWLVGLAANAVLFRLTIIATNPEGVGTGETQVSGATMLALDLSLMAVYLGLFCYRALVKGKGVKAFDVIQSGLVLLVGFGGAVRIANTTGQGAGVLGWTALVAAVAFYSIAFTFVRNRLGRGRGFFYFASLALVFLFLGSQVIAHGPWLAWIWLALGLVMAILGSLFNRVTLRAHSIIYLVLASINTGLLAFAMDAFAASANSAWHPLGHAGAVNLAVLIICYALFILRQGHDLDSRGRRTPGILAAVLTLMGLSSLFIILLTRVLTGLPPEATPAIVAVTRTAVLSVFAVALAAACRRSRLRELAWLVYPLLGLGCLKILFEDLRQGNALTLFVAFGFFGAALILSPRLVASGRKSRIDGE
jgi:hypothetical protein